MASTGGDIPNSQLITSTPASTTTSTPTTPPLVSSSSGLSSFILSLSSVLSSAVSPSTTSLPTTSIASTSPTMLGTTTVGNGTSVTSNLATSGSSSSISTKHSSTSHNATSTSTAKAAVAHHSTTLSDGAAAGIGIGCAIAGALIAACVVWFLLRRSRKRSSIIYRDLPQEKIFSSPLLEGELIQPLPEKAISGEVSNLGILIKNHAQSFYTRDDMEVNRKRLHVLAEQLLGTEAPISSQNWVSMLSVPDSRIAAIRFLLAWVMLQRIDPASNPDTSLLPPEIAGSLHAMQSDEVDTRTRILLMSKWRHISATLNPSNYSNRTIAQDDTRMPYILTLAAALDAVLRHFESQRVTPTEREKHLEEMVKRAAYCGYIQCYQPTTWAFDWEEQRKSLSADILVFPRLLQTGNDVGNVLTPSKVWAEALFAKTAGI